MDGICCCSAGLLAGSSVSGHGHDFGLLAISTSRSEPTDPTAPMAGERARALGLELEGKPKRGLPGVAEIRFMRSAQCQISPTAGPQYLACNDVGGGAKPVSKCRRPSERGRRMTDQGTPVCYQGSTA